MAGEIAPQALSALRQLSSCAVANAIETFGVRLRNTGFANASIECRFDEMRPLVGYAVTARLRTSLPPMLGHHHLDRTDWWENILQGPAPRVVVIEDVDDPPGLGALVGHVHANILRALGVVGVVTNGAVRDAPDLRAIGMQCFARQFAVSHAYAHIFEFGTPVTVGGLHIRPGDLLHGDRHGLQQIPLDIASAIPAVAERMLARDTRIIALCQSREFSPEKLRALILEISDAPAPHAMPPVTGGEGQR